jgi:hypothetical protein
VRPTGNQTARTAAPARRCNGVALISQFRHFAGSMNFVTTPGGFMGKREAQIILKTEARNLLLESGRDGKFVAKTVGWGENRLFLHGDKLEVAAKNGRPVLTHLPAGPRPRVGPVRHYFDTE